MQDDQSIRDAFGRVRVSNPFTLLDSKQLYDKQPLFFDEAITNTSGNASSTHSPINACTTMYVEPGDKVTRQSFMRLNYQPGKSQMALLTGVLGEPAIGVTSRIGIFDDSNGLFFQQSNGMLAVVIRKNGVDTIVPQTHWNTNKLDRESSTDIDIDPSKCQIFAIDMEWLGVGTARFSFIIDGAVHYVHKAHHANSVTSVYMSTPNLPVRYEIESTTGTGSMDHICCSVASEGGLDPNGVTRSLSSPKVDANAIGTAYAVLGLRLKDTHVGATVIPRGVSMFCSTNDSFQWQLLFNPTVAGTFTYADVSAESCCQSAAGATENTVTGGTQIAGGYAASQQPLTSVVESALRLGSSIDGTLDTIVLAVSPMSVSADIYGSIDWQELH